jgi:[protein-PII] uridylyltransferase
MKSPIVQLQQRKQELISRFLRNEEGEFLKRHAEILDDYFSEVFSSSRVGPRMRLDKHPYAIIALGGYGRKEQCLHSDIDVLLLFRKQVPEETKELVQEIFYPLWDTGLEVGYAIRSLKECQNLASEDFEVLTSLLDARFLCGISSLYSELLEVIRGKVLRRHGEAFIQWLVERNQERHSRFGDSSYLLEPNLKEGQGGLRDYHAILWIAWTKFRINEPRDLEYLGHLSHDEYQTLGRAVSFIWRVRNLLHHLTQRKCDQLYFEYQTALTSATARPTTDEKEAVERFLGDLHGHMDFLKQQHLMFLGRVMPTKRRFRFGQTQRRLALKGIQVSEGSLNFDSSEAILENPRLLLEIFEQSATLGLPLNIEARRLVQEFLYLIDDQVRRSPIVPNCLERILLAPEQPIDVLEEIFSTGLMLVLIPEFKGILNRIQYDQYHLYPVDKHSLRTVQVMKSFARSNLDEQDRLCGQLFSEVTRPELLLWAALFHDVGKGEQGPDHARQGAEIVRRVLRRLGFPEADLATVAFLVLEHLLLVKTATQRDLNDEKTVILSARRIPDLDHLKMLYLLTVADSKATGPKAWNDWIAVLLKELFFKVYHILEKGELAKPGVVEILERKKTELFRLAADNLPQELDAIFDQMSPRYLLYTPARSIASHVELYQRLGTKRFVLDVQTPGRGEYRTVTVCAQDRPGLFSKISGVLTLNNLNILNAEIYTWRNHIALDIFTVTAPPDPLREEEAWAQVRSHLQAVLEGELALEPALEEKVRAYQSALNKTLSRPDSIVVDNRTSDFFTIIEIYTHDFPGLLYKITNALFQCRLDVWIAKIATKVDQVVDVFYVRDLEGQKVDGVEQATAIEEAIRQVLTSSPR